jgi:DNA end-binding protein Ku
LPDKKSTSGRSRRKRPRPARSKRKQDAPKNEERAREGSVRAQWSGTITFGMVSIPVDVFPTSRTDRVSLRMLDAEGQPLRQRYFCPRHDEPLDDEEIVRGYPLEDGRYVVVTDEELEALSPEKSRDIELQRFVDKGEVDPLMLERAYFLVPAGDSTKPYRLLAATLQKTRRAGIATFVMRGKAYLAAISAEEGILQLQTLRHRDEVRSADDIGLGPTSKADRTALREIKRAIKDLTADALDVSELEDRQTQRMRALVERKYERGEDVVEISRTADQRSTETTLVDLMQALKARLAGDGAAARE